MVARTDRVAPAHDFDHDIHHLPKSARGLCVSQHSTSCMLSTMSRLLIDGSVLEGGGQILRNSVALSALLQKPIAIKNIRQRRKPPGLKAQHAAGTLHFVLLVSSLTYLQACNWSQTFVLPS